MPDVEKLQFEIVMDETGAVKSVGKISKSTKELEKTTVKTSKKMESLGQRIKKNWIKVAAAVGGALLGLKKAFDFTKQFQEYRQGMDALAKNTGQNSEKIIKKLREVSAGTISNRDLVIGANRAVALNVTKDVGKMSQLLEIARVKARAMGITTTQAFNDMVTGIGRGSPLILDNLGIITKGWAEQAKASGKAMDAQFILNKILKDGAKELGRTGKVALTGAEKIQMLFSSLDNLKTTLGEIISPLLLPLIGAVTKVVKAFGSLPKPIQTGAVGLVALTAALKGITLALGAMSFSPLLIGLSAVVIAVTGIMTLLNKARNRVRLLAGEVSQADKMTLENMAEKSRDALKELEKQIIKQQGAIDNLLKTNDKARESQNRYNEAIEDFSENQPQAQQQLEDMSNEYLNESRALKKAKGALEELDKQRSEETAQLGKVMGQLRRLAEVRTETGESAKAGALALAEAQKEAVRGYYEFLGLQRELDAEKETEAFEVAKTGLQALWDSRKITYNEFLIAREELTLTHEKNMKVIQDEARKERDLLDKASFETYGKEFEKLTNNQKALLKVQLEDYKANKQKQLESEKKWNNDLSSATSTAIGNTVSSWSDSFAEMAVSAKTWKMKFTDFIGDMVKAIGKLIIKLLVTKTIMAGLGLGGIGGLGIFKKGGLFLKAEEGGKISGPSHSGGGVNVEAEGGEYFVRKESVTPETLPILMAINRGMGNLAALTVARNTVMPRAQEGGMVSTTNANRTANIGKVQIMNPDPRKLFDQFISYGEDMGVNMVRRG